MARKHRKQYSLLNVGLGILAVLMIVVIIMAIQTFGLMGQVQFELSVTPSPVPVMANVMQVTPDPNRPTAEPMIKNGSIGDEVSQLQERLKALGFYSGTVDGQFGTGTKNAVMAFQTQHKLESDGVVGPMTKDLIYSDEAQIAVSTPTPAPTATLPPLDGTGLPMLVNRDYPIPDGFQPKNMVKMNDVCDANVVIIKNADTYGCKEAVDALMEMLKAAHRDGLDSWQISAGYRTYDMQKTLFDEQVAVYITKNELSQEDAISATKKTVAEPGTSEHHTGLAFDVTVPGKYFSDTEQSKWLAKNCWDYGFIMRYQAEKQAITGFLAEAWHVRYVGTQHSIPMRDKNLCLEEYLQLKVSE